jgi:hypothetical protein
MARSSARLGAPGVRRALVRHATRPRAPAGRSPRWRAHRPCAPCREHIPWHTAHRMPPGALPRHRRIFDNEHRRAISAQTVERLARLSHVVFRISFFDVIEAEQKLFPGGRVDLCANRCIGETPFGFLIDDAKSGMAGAHELRQGLDEVHHVRLDIGAFCANLRMSSPISS